MQSFRRIQSWAPVQIDALGLVTILGAESAKHVLGQLTANRFTDWLPLLAAHVIATDEFAQPQGGFALYNISDGIMANDLTGWFTRWLLSEDLANCSSNIKIVTFTSKAMDKKQKMDQNLSRAFGLLGLAPALLAGLIGDWWGLANGLAVLISVLVRRFVLAEHRRAVDDALYQASKTSTEPVKVFTTLPNGTAVTISTTRGILIDCLLTITRPRRRRLYNAVRNLGWLVFGIHLISLGMASLFSQILYIVSVITATLVTFRQVGTNRRRVGHNLELTIEKRELRFRAATFASLELTKSEEDSMILWNLMPHRSYKNWWEKYETTKKDGNFERWDRALASA